MPEISASILSIDSEKSMKILHELDEAKIDYFHIDVMDGVFVERNTSDIMYRYCSEVKQISTIPLDVHLMVKDIKKYVDDYLAFEPSIITFHLEAIETEKEGMELIKYINSNGVKCGISISPETDVEEIYKYLPHIHMALIMTVVPGKGGQALIPETIIKIKELKNYIEQNNLDTYIEADGGINLDNVKEVRLAGTDIIVAGTAITNSNNYKNVTNTLKSE
ncbi:MAG: ribulose-phosphate 3-epimerase [Lachnospiraceae bacterium]|jgi:ribulose-phosphate 3-epimerase|nr:ribulose-phosphate 3-epimerase [Lachnospiraceae bacterium]